jgi:hypothetical protein
MKKIELATASRPLSSYADELDDEILVLTAAGKPVAAIVSLKDVDPESWALSTSGVFQQLIEKARAEIEMGKSLTLEEMRREVLS